VEGCIVAAGNSRMRSGRQSMLQVGAKVVVASGIEELWEFLTDYSRLAQHLKALSRSRLVEDRDGFKLVEQAVRPGVPLLPAEVSMVLRITEKRPTHIHFEQVSGYLRSFRGRWLLEQRAGSVSLSYEATAVMGGFLVPKVFAQRMLQQGAEKSLEQVKAVVEQRARLAVSVKRP